MRKALIGVAAAAGFIVGPALGGFLAEFSPVLPALLSALLYAADFAFVALCVPESNQAVLAAEAKTKAANDDADDDAPEKNKANARRVAKEADQKEAEQASPGFVASFRAALATPLVGELLCIYALFNLGFLTMKSNFSVFNAARFDFGPAENGYVLVISLFFIFMCCLWVRLHNIDTFLNISIYNFLKKNNSHTWEFFL